eukprot:scaffold34110_cov74-Phaeocystis_antarctica.AAC.4
MGNANRDDRESGVAHTSLCNRWNRCTLSTPPPAPPAPAAPAALARSLGGSSGVTGGAVRRTRRSSYAAVCPSAAMRTRPVSRGAGRIMVDGAGSRVLQGAARVPLGC